jgi:hypothetical protein
LLTRAAEIFDVLVTVDRRIAHQQDLPQFEIAVLVLRARSNRLSDLAPLMTRLTAAIESAPTGQATEISSPDPGITAPTRAP